MLNPFGPEREPGLSSYANVQKRVLQNIQAAKINDQVFLAVQNAFENALQAEHVVLSRPERKLLFLKILRAVLADMLQKLDDSTKAGSSPS